MPEVPVPFVAANFKVNKDGSEVDAWFRQFGEANVDFPGTIVVCPSMAFISQSSRLIEDLNLPLQLGSQDISQFGLGAHTGEVAAAQIKDLVQFTIIGHSERRASGETDEIAAKKVEQALEAGINPIFCVQDENTPIPQGVKVVAYEPISAIGTGNPATPENAGAVAQSIKAKGDYIVLYGGSVAPQNVASFLSQGPVDGVLVGGASLDVQSFLGIIKALTK